MAGAVLQHGQGIGEAGRYVVRKKIGEGQFAEVYEVDDARTNTVLALKLERRTNVRTVQHEGKVLQLLSQSCQQVCKVHDSGSYHHRHFIVMDLLGQNLAETRRGEPGGRAELATAKVVGAGLLAALEGIHRAGYIHRDVKPANFAVSPPGAPALEGRWVLIDFGLARKFVDESGQTLQERPDASFRGSTTYASVHTHDNKDQSRRDDLWSWFYVLVELLEGTLPWRAAREAGTPAAAGDGTANAREVKDGVAQRKAECIQHPEQLFSSMPCPEAVRKLNSYLRSLGFGDEPDYGVLRALLGKLDKPAAAELNGGVEAAQPALPPAPTTSPPSPAKDAAEPPPVQQPVAQQPATAHRSKEQPLRERPSSDAAQPPAAAAPSAAAAPAPAPAGAPAEKPPTLARGGSAAASEPRGRDAGSSRDRDGGKERDDEREHDRGRERDRHQDRGRDRDRKSHRDRERRRERSERDYERSDRDGGRRRSRSRNRRSRSRERRSRSREARSRSRDRRRSRSHGRRAASRSRSRTRSPAPPPPRKEEPRKVEPQREDLREQMRNNDRDLMAQNKYRSMRHFVASLRQGGLSADGARAAQHLTTLPPAEAVGVACWYLDELSAGVDPQHAAVLAQVLDEAAAFLGVVAKDCGSRAKQA